MEERTCSVAASSGDSVSSASASFWLTDDDDDDDDDDDVDADEAEEVERVAKRDDVDLSRFCKRVRASRCACCSSGALAEAAIDAGRVDAVENGLAVAADDNDEDDEDEDERAERAAAACEAAEVMALSERLVLAMDAEASERCEARDVRSLEADMRGTRSMRVKLKC
jgi:hypothetical protein